MGQNQDFNPGFLYIMAYDRCSYVYAAMYIFIMIIVLNTDKTESRLNIPDNWNTFYIFKTNLND